MSFDGKKEKSMKYFALILPLSIIALFIFASIKRIKIYDSFAVGATKSVDTVLSIFPYLITVFIMTELFTQSGLSEFIIRKCSPVFMRLGIPPEITPLVLIKPFSGSGGLASLNDIYTAYGVDSYVSRCASAVFGSSETVFYISAVYYSGSKEKRSARAIVISLVSTFISTVFACVICKYV